MHAVRQSKTKKTKKTSLKSNLHITSISLPPPPPPKQEEDARQFMPPHKITIQHKPKKKTKYVETHMGITRRRENMQIRT